jgi:peptide chain release factor 1
MLDKLAETEQRYEELESLMADPEVAGDYSQLETIIREHGAIRHVVTLSREYRKVIGDIAEARLLAREETDREMAALARDEMEELDQQKSEIEENLRIALIPKDPNDEKNVIMEVRAGTGGEEAGLFAAEMYRMYSRYAQRRNWKVDIINSNESGLGSIKEIIFQIDGAGAYSRLKHESGTHRVQRVPLTESSGRIHTSATTVAVLPEAEEVDVELDDDDLQIDVFFASGHGGQSVQKNATAIRITHKPTGLVVSCQDERSQHKNKTKAMAVLRSRILAQEIAKQHEEISEDRRSQVGTGDRSGRVRTYNFPQDRVTDHRVNYTRHNLEVVLDGEIDDIIDELIKAEQTRNLEGYGV